MNRREIYDKLDDCSSWHDADIEVRAGFVKRCRKVWYDHDALLQAWSWYLMGWKDR